MKKIILILFCFYSTFSFSQAGILDALAVAPDLLGLIPISPKQKEINIDKETKDLKQSLNLDELQEYAVRDYIEKRWKEETEILNNTKLTDDQKKAAIQETYNKMDASIYKILNPDQKEKYTIEINLRKLKKEYNIKEK